MQKLKDHSFLNESLYRQEMSPTNIKSLKSQYHEMYTKKNPIINKQKTNSNNSSFNNTMKIKLNNLKSNLTKKINETNTKIVMNRSNCLVNSVQSKHIQKEEKKDNSSKTNKSNHLRNSSHIPIYINSTSNNFNSTQQENIKTMKKNNFLNETRSFSQIMKEKTVPRNFSNLETSEQDDDFKIISKKKSDLESKLQILKAKYNETDKKMKNNPSNNSFIQSSTNKINIEKLNRINRIDSFSNNNPGQFQMIDSINDHNYIQNTFGENTDEIQLEKLTDYEKNKRNFTTNYNKSETEVFGQYLNEGGLNFHDEILHSDNNFKDLILKNRELNSKLELKDNNISHLNKAVKIMSEYVKVLQDKFDENLKKSNQGGLNLELKIENETLKIKNQELKKKISEVYKIINSYENNEIERSQENNRIVMQLLKENEYLRKICENNLFVSKIENSEETIYKSNDDLLKEYKNGKKRNNSQILKEYLSNSPINSSMVRDKSSHNKRKDFLLEDLNQSLILKVQENENSKKKQYLFLKTPKNSDF